MYEGNITVGALLRSEVRRFLSECEFRGKVYKWHESKHFLESRFIYQCKYEEHLKTIHNSFMNWKKQFNG